MHTLKVIALLLFTLGIMRVVSWAVGWGLSRWWRGGETGLAAIVSNGLALCLFLGYLVWDRLPGETLDPAAAVFGVGVYGVYALIDWRWRPWRSAGARRVT